jgi:hypothetical protein
VHLERVERAHARVKRLEDDLSEARRLARRALLEAAELRDRDGRAPISQSQLARMWGTGPTRVGEWIARARAEREVDG